MQKWCLCLLGMTLLTACAPSPIADTTRQSVQAYSVSADSSTQDFSFKTKDGLQLRAKLTLPVRASGPVPVVLFLGGSGPWDSDYASRDKQIVPLPKLAERFAASGIAFVRYQKRGVTDPGGVPTTEWKTATLDNLLADARQVLGKIKADPRLDPHRIALVGQSEGTQIATWIGGSDPDIKAFALLGVAFRNLKEILDYQLVDRQLEIYFPRFDLNQDNYLDANEIDTAATQHGAKFGDWEKFDRDDDHRLSQSEFRAIAEAGFKSIVHRISEMAPDELTPIGPPAGWFQQHFAHKSVAHYWKNIDTPVLIQQGTQDINTPYKSEAVAMIQQLESQKHPDSRLITYDGMDHFLMAGSSSRAETVFKDTVAWVSKRLKR